MLFLAYCCSIVTSWVDCYACLGLLIVLFIICILFVVLRCVTFARVDLIGLACCNLFIAWPVVVGCLGLLCVA